MSSMLPSTAQSIGQKNQLGLLNRAPLCNESLLFIASGSARTALWVWQRACALRSQSNHLLWDSFSAFRQNSKKGFFKNMNNKGWACCEMGHRSWWPVTWRGLRYSVLPLHQSLPVKQACRNSRPLRLEEKSGTWWWRTRLGCTLPEGCEPDRLQVLRELANDVVGPLVFIFEWPRRLRHSSRLEERKYTLQENQEGRFGNLQANQLHLSSW